MTAFLFGVVVGVLLVLVSTYIYLRHLENIDPMDPK